MNAGRGLIYIAPLVHGSLPDTCSAFGPTESRVALLTGPDTSGPPRFERARKLCREKEVAIHAGPGRSGTQAEHAAASNSDCQQVLSRNSPRARALERRSGETRSGQLAGIQLRPEETVATNTSQPLGKQCSCWSLGQPATQNF